MSQQITRRDAVFGTSMLAATSVLTGEVLNSAQAAF
jgi:hypothetical protein